MNQALLESQLVIDEGERLKPYLDTVNKITIGVGRNLTDEGISAGESRMLLKNDINGHVGDLDAELSWWRSLNDARQNALANMCFNMGIETLMTFTTFLALLQEGKYSEAAQDLAGTAWAREVGDRAVRIRSLIDTGEFPQ